MIDNLAACIDPACTRTRIFTFLSKTSLVQRTLRTNDALWSTIWRSTDIVRDTRAYGMVVHHSTNAVRPTRWWLTWIDRFFSNWTTRKMYKKLAILLRRLKFCVALLSGWGVQDVNGFPMYPAMQVQDGEWLTTWHSALLPHVPGQGSTHLLLIHDRVLGQSLFMTHSGLQPTYGSPKYSGKQEHEPAPLCSLQIALTPQGFGLHGIGGGS